MMKVEWKDKWLKALRSGKYTQTRGVLNRTIESSERSGTPVGMCCLGVLCDVFAKEGLGEWKGIDVDGDRKFIYKDHTQVTQPPYSLLEEIGLSDTAVETLIGLNDRQRKSFDEIADWIEQYA